MIYRAIFPHANLRMQDKGALSLHTLVLQRRDRYCLMVHPLPYYLRVKDAKVEVNVDHSHDDNRYANDPVHFFQS